MHDLEQSSTNWSDQPGCFAFLRDPLGDTSLELTPPSMAFAAMPIRREHRFFYPIDWPQLSAVIRFRRAGGRCEVCQRPHGRTVYHLGDGRWWDAEAGIWRDGAGRIICLAVGAEDVLGRVRTTRVVLAAAHRDHDSANNTSKNLAAFCQRCHMIHDQREHQRRRWRTLFRRKAMGDLFRGPYD